MAELDVFGKYVFSLYFAVQTLFTVGYGDLAPSEGTSQIWVACVAALLGAYLYALIIANMTSVLINMDVTYTRYKNKVDELHDYMGKRTVPADLQHRIMMYFRYIYDRQKGELEEDSRGEQGRGEETRTQQTRAEQDRRKEIPPPSPPAASTPLPAHHWGAVRRNSLHLTRTQRSPPTSSTITRLVLQVGWSTRYCRICRQRSRGRSRKRTCPGS